MINTPCHRNSDPITSYLADKHITQSGKRMADVRRAENAVRLHSGYTCRELSALTGIPNEILHKRLPDSNKLVKGQMVKCMITGRMASQWFMRHKKL